MSSRFWQLFFFIYDFLESIRDFDHCNSVHMKNLTNTCELNIFTSIEKSHEKQKLCFPFAYAATCVTWDSSNRYNIPTELRFE